MSCDNTHKLLYQYQDSPNLISAMLAFTAEYCSLSDAQDQLETRLDIGLSEGIQLDWIGVIVGQPRPLTIQLDDEDAFAFDGGEGLGWSSLENPQDGGRFVGLDGLFVGKMPDPDYRTLLRARIYSNRAEATVDSILGFLNFIFGPGNAIDNGVGYIDITLARGATSIELDIMNRLIPIAAGVRVRNVTQP